MTSPPCSPRLEPGPRADGQLWLHRIRNLPPGPGSRPNPEGGDKGGSTTPQSLPVLLTVCCLGIAGAWRRSGIAAPECGDHVRRLARLHKLRRDRSRSRSRVGTRTWRVSTACFTDHFRARRNRRQIYRRRRHGRLRSSETNRERRGPRTCMCPRTRRCLESLEASQQPPWPPGATCRYRLHYGTVVGGVLDSG